LNPNRDTLRFAGIVALIGQIMWLTTILTGAAKIWANAAVVLIAATLCLTFLLQAGLEVVIVRSKSLLLSGAALFLFTATALGVFLGNAFQGDGPACPACHFYGSADAMLPGGETPVQSQPPWLQTLTLLLPSRHYTSASDAIGFKGAGQEVVWPEFIWMGFLGAALFGCSLLLFRTSVAH
jgi:ABC-2 type transport system permease protein